MHRIAAAPLLALMLIAGRDARAAETTRIITLSCEGTVRSGPEPGDVQRVSERRVVVNLAEHTVTGFVTNAGSALIANIIHVDDTRIDFTGGSTSSSVFGTLDRVTGATTVHTTTWARDKIKGGKTIRGLSYFLVCKVNSPGALMMPPTSPSPALCPSAASRRRGPPRRPRLASLSPDPSVLGRGFFLSVDAGFVAG